MKSERQKKRKEHSRKWKSWISTNKYNQQKCSLNKEKESRESFFRNLKILVFPLQMTARSVAMTTHRSLPLPLPSPSLFFSFNGEFSVVNCCWKCSTSSFFYFFPGNSSSSLWLVFRWIFLCWRFIYLLPPWKALSLDLPIGSRVIISVEKSLIFSKELEIDTRLRIENDTFGGTLHLSKQSDKVISSNEIYLPLPGRIFRERSHRSIQWILSKFSFVNYFSLSFGEDSAAVSSQTTVDGEQRDSDREDIC